MHGPLHLGAGKPSFRQYKTNFVCTGTHNKRQSPSAAECMSKGA